MDFLNIAFLLIFFDHVFLLTTKSSFEHCKQQMRFFFLARLAAVNKIFSCCHAIITETRCRLLRYSVQTRNTKTWLKI